RLRAAIASYEFPHGKKQPGGRLTISGGVAAFPHHGTNSTELLSHADQAHHDGLTLLLNKRRFMEQLGLMINRAEKHAQPLGVFIFDIDHFKNYNDVNGHVAGDHLLRLLSHLVADNIRAEDVFGRFGGEEFLLILPDRSLDEASHLSEKLRQEIEGYQFPYGEWQPLGRLTVSGGVAAFPD
ncbi:MAG: diguanylate cyclase, partial [bacterium]|nr:diguanylate cyclase [bacterium]